LPLSTTLRPKNLTEFIGQNHIIDIFASFVTQDKIPSMILWGPPASGKTTLAEIIASSTKSAFYRLSAVLDKKSDLTKIISKAEIDKKNNIKTIVFIDEIHRWSKSQQDTLLPFVERGDIILIGATTENPSFTVISPLLSRSRVFVLKQHTPDQVLVALLRGYNYLTHEEPAPDTIGVLKYLSEISNCDIRFGLNSLEIAFNLANGKNILKEIIESSVQKFLRYDKKGEEHYNIISAVHKSIRSSNPTAAVYWIVRMLQAGDDPLYIARRLLRFASEDIGNANPNALLLANVVYDTCHKLGMPECNTALVQLAEYLARSKKNNSAYTATKQAEKDIKEFGNLEVPLHFRNAPTKLMKEIGYGKGYEYDHDLKNKKSTQQCMPDELKDRNYFG